MQDGVTDKDRARVNWLLGYIKGAMIGVWAMCGVQERVVVDAGSLEELEQHVDELTELVEGMMQG